MSTGKQIEANRNNALASTGPITANGKAKGACNALKHGILAREVVITAGDGAEDSSEYHRLQAALVADLAPVGEMELLLVEKIAVNYWRLRRVVGYETGRIRRLLGQFMEEALDRGAHGSF